MEERGSWSRDRAPLAALVVLGAVCAACVVANHDLPLVRTGIVYARAAEHVIEQGFER